jgi:hypothetical protein
MYMESMTLLSSVVSVGYRRPLSVRSCTLCIRSDFPALWAVSPILPGLPCLLVARFLLLPSSRLCSIGGLVILTSQAPTRSIKHRSFLIQGWCGLCLGTRLYPPEGRAIRSSWVAHTRVTHSAVIPTNTPLHQSRFPIHSPAPCPFMLPATIIFVGAIFSF